MFCLRGQSTVCASLLKSTNLLLEAALFLLSTGRQDSSGGLPSVGGGGIPVSSTGILYGPGPFAGLALRPCHKHVARVASARQACVPLTESP